MLWRGVLSAGIDVGSSDKRSDEPLTPSPRSFYQ